MEPTTNSKVPLFPIPGINSQGAFSRANRGMSNANTAMPLRYLFIDFDSFFAAVEQQLRPELRGRPVGVVPAMGVDTTCCIAASYEAKRFEVKTGTNVREARLRCPGIQFVEASHSRYIEVHHRAKSVVESCLHVEAVESIDEMYGKLPSHWSPPEVARSRAVAIKQALAAEIGPYITASIGIAPNRFLAKMASKRHKPDGLTLFEASRLPEALFDFELKDVHGIGRRMEPRLRSAGINSVEALCLAPRHRLHAIWGSVDGDRLWAELRGEDVPPVTTRRQSISHSHVLEPRFRTCEGARTVMHRMLQKACRRLRILGFHTGRLSVSARFGFEHRWSEDTTFFPTQDSVVLGGHTDRLWQGRPSELDTPTKVGVTLLDLIPSEAHTPSLFPEENNERRLRLQRAMDDLNIRYGGQTVYYAPAHLPRAQAPASAMRIAFNHIPDPDTERD